MDDLRVQYFFSSEFSAAIVTVQTIKTAFRRSKQLAKKTVVRPRWDLYIAERLPFLKTLRRLFVDDQEHAKKKGHYYHQIILINNKKGELMALLATLLKEPCCSRYERISKNRKGAYHKERVGADG